MPAKKTPSTDDLQRDYLDWASGQDGLPDTPSIFFRQDTGEAHPGVTTAIYPSELAEILAWHAKLPDAELTLTRRATSVEVCVRGRVTSRLTVVARAEAMLDAAKAVRAVFDADEPPTDHAAALRALASGEPLDADVAAEVVAR